MMRYPSFHMPGDRRAFTRPPFFFAFLGKLCYNPKNDRERNDHNDETTPKGS